MVLVKIDLENVDLIVADPEDKTAAEDDARNQENDTDRPTTGKKVQSDEGANTKKGQVRKREGRRKRRELIEDKASKQI